MVLTDIAAGPVLANTAAKTPARRIQAAVPQAREALSEFLAATVGKLPRLSDDIADVLTAVFAVLLIRIEDLGGEDAMRERVNIAMRTIATGPALHRPPIHQRGRNRTT